MGAGSLYLNTRMLWWLLLDTIKRMGLCDGGCWVLSRLTFCDGGCWISVRTSHSLNWLRTCPNRRTSPALQSYAFGVRMAHVRASWVSFPRNLSFSHCKDATSTATNKTKNNSSGHKSKAKPQARPKARTHRSQQTSPSRLQANAINKGTNEIMHEIKMKKYEAVREAETRSQIIPQTSPRNTSTTRTSIFGGSRSALLACGSS